MEINRISKNVIILLISIFCISGILATIFGLAKPNTSAIKTGDGSSFVKVSNGTDLWAGSTINASVAKELFKFLGNSSTADYNTLQTNITSENPKSAADLRGHNKYGKNSTQSIVVRLGGLDWIVTYISVSDVDSDNDGNNDIIATLWLTNNEQDAWQSMSTGSGSFGQYYVFEKSTETGKIGLYANWSANWVDSSSYNYSYPSNMYGTSYISTVVLNNGGVYATNYNTIVAANTDSNGYGAKNPFYLFTTPVSGNMNDLTDFIVTPNNVSWQNSIQDKNLIGYVYGYHSSNDSLDNTGGDFSSSYYDYSNKTYYTAWGDDYLWLPSLTEVGLSDSKYGIWETITSERNNHNGSTTSYIGDNINHAWLRTANNTDSSSSHSLHASGNSGENIYYLNSYLAVRPALHLNLKTLSKSMSATITLNQQSGSNGTTSIEAYNNEPLPTIIPPTRTGFAFGGYYSSTNGSGTQYYKADGTSAINYPDSGGATTLYAYWQQLYTLMVNTNDPTLGKAYGSGTYAAGAQISIDASGVLGSSLLYWSVKNASGTEINKIYENEYTLTMPAYNVTYTAIFGKGVEGINASATYGGMVAIVGDNFESLSNSDTITLVATVCVTGYQFKHWINQDGTILASGEENKTYLIPKSQAMDSIITAVFEPIT